MKNITVSLPDDLYRRARIRAAEENTSVSAVVRRFLLSYTEQESDSERRKRVLHELLAKPRSFSAKDRLDRDEAHER